MYLYEGIVKKSREKIGMSVEELAKKVGCTELLIKYYESAIGEIYASNERVIALSKALKIPLKELTGDDTYGMTVVRETNKYIQEEVPGDHIGQISDGYHTFDELYHHRALLFASLCDILPELFWKSKKHEDGTMYDDMFIVGMKTHSGQATYHYDIDPYWDMFNCTELENAPIFDGHTPADAIERIKNECEIIKDKIRSSVIKMEDILK